MPGVSEQGDVLFELTAELSPGAGFGQRMNQVYGCGPGRLPGFREADAGAAAVSRRFFGQETEPLKAPQNPSQALPADAKPFSHLRGRGGFEFCYRLKRIQRAFGESEAG
ncbi:UNVERIFIED_ORG: hypothetical protein J2X79_004636 [Arthrobacter globiformis]|nr:hypothetical protein [Arthrobacter globiformis]